ncbi:MAG TPA: diaminopimelate epimerase [Fluviicola sp.]|nr:diaminopimelate epimerase [Fluviicola sp.]
MNIPFTKYQGTGNDFVMIDNRKGKWNDLPLQTIRAMCDRRFGVGADGLIKLNASPDLDFEVDYYNADGSKSFCGNGARCAVAFARQNGIDTSAVRFMAIDGEHLATQAGDIVSLLMNEVHAVNRDEEAYVIDTGSPHYIRFIDNVEGFPVYDEGFKIRYSDRYKAEGINVNFAEVTGERSLFVVTYERGVEDETLSCGTGVTAAALAFAKERNLLGNQVVAIKTKGGGLQVTFNRTGEETFERIFLNGPAVKVFEGVYNGRI